MIESSELPPRLRFDGGRMMKPNGQEIILRGPCYGSWGADDPLDAPFIASMGANSVRVALRFWGKWGFKPETDSRDNDGFAFLARANFEQWISLISEVSATGMWAIPFIDSNCGQSGMQDAETRAYCDPKGTWFRGHNFYTDAGMRRVFASIVWPAAAQRLRLIPRVAMLEIHPEPAVGGGADYAPLVTQVHREVIEGIRAVDPDTPILIGARDAYEITVCAEAFQDDFTNVAYTGNLLNPWIIDPRKFDKGLRCLTDLRERRNVPIYCQQLGRRTDADPDRRYMRRALQRMREENVGFAWWQWKQNSEDPGDYALNFKNGSGGWVQKPEEIALLSEFL